MCKMTPAPVFPNGNADHTHRAEQSQERRTKPAMRDWRKLTGAVIERHSVPQTWAAAWDLSRRFGQFQDFIWSDIAEVAKTLPAAGLDRLAAFRIQIDAQQFRRAGGAA